MRIECDKTAAKLATLILRVSSGNFFDRRHRNVKPVAVKDGRAGYAREPVIFNLRRPDKLAGAGVNRVHACSEVAEVKCKFRF